jgi:hypothetical protein
MSDEELIARLRSMHWCVTTEANGVGVSDSKVALDAADRIEALSGLNKKLILKVSHYSDLLYDQLGTPCEQIRHKQEIEALEAKLAAAIKLAELIRRYAGMGMNPSTDLQHMASDLLAMLKGERHA